MKFDSNRAWQQASAMISANREVVLAMAGVFFLLPQLVIALMFPEPAIGDSMTQEQMLEAMRVYYVSMLPVSLPLALFQSVGTISVLILLGDSTRPTVGEAIRRSLKAVVPYILGALLLGLAFGLVAALAAGLGAATGGTALAVILIAAVLFGAVYVGIRCSLSAATIALDGILNPVAALKRSWDLTRGNAARILGFYALILIGAVVISSVAGIVIGLPLSLAFGAETGRIVQMVIAALVGAVISLYLVAIIAAVHRQLAGPDPRDEASTFE